MNRWPRNKAYFWEIAPFFRILLPFAAGILCYYLGWLSKVPIIDFTIAAILSFVCLAVLVISKTTGKYISFALLTIALFSCGISISGYNDVRNDKSWFGNSIGHTKAYFARISATPDEKENSWKLSVNILSAIDSGKTIAVTGKAFVYLQKDSLPLQLQRGDTILIPGKWMVLKDAGNPFEFSYATYCARNNIFYRQWCNRRDVRLYGACNPAALPLTEITHDWCMAQLQKYLGAHEAMGLLQAMLLGDEVNLDEDLRQSYSQTGIVHIIAISGGNVGIFFMVIAFLLGWIKHKKHEWVKYALAIPVIWFYILMAGAQPSATRAAVLFSLLAVGTMFQKNNNGINHLFATAFLLLVAKPAWLFSVGFQLSFVAVLSIMLFYKPVYNWLPMPVLKAKGKGKILLQWIYNIPRALWSAIAMSIAAEILVAPLVIYYYHSFPVMFIVANVAAFLFMGIVLVLGMVLVTASAVPLLAELIATAIKWLVDIFGNLVNHMQDMRPESFNYLMLSGFETLIMYTAIGGVAWFLLRQYKPALFTGMGASCLLLGLLCFDEWDALYRQRLVIYNVAHTTHIELLQDKRYSILQTDTTFSKQVAYATLPAHIGWHAWKEQQPSEREIFSMRGKTILILNSDIKSNAPFPVDFLILNTKGTVNVSSLKKLFTPSVIILGGNYSIKEQMEIADACTRHGIACHQTGHDGAVALVN